MAGDLGSEGLEILILLCLIGEEIKTGHLSSFITERLPRGDLRSSSGCVMVNPLYQLKTSERASERDSPAASDRDASTTPLRTSVSWSRSAAWKPVDSLLNGRGGAAEAL